VSSPCTTSSSALDPNTLGYAIVALSAVPASWQHPEWGQVWHSQPTAPPPLAWHLNAHMLTSLHVHQQCSQPRSRPEAYNPCFTHVYAFGQGSPNISRRRLAHRSEAVPWPGGMCARVSGGGGMGAKGETGELDWLIGWYAALLPPHPVRFPPPRAVVLMPLARYPIP